jgi:hypothetical protein
MNDITAWLRAQMPSSTDPDRLERLAREAERQAVLRSGIATMGKGAHTESAARMTKLSRS